MEVQEKKSINIEIGQNIRKYRESAGLSREAFAEKLGLSSRFIANIEVGAVGASLSTIKKVCEVLCISSDRILWSNEEPVTLDERLQHIPDEYMPYVTQSLLAIADIIEKSKEKEQA